MGNPNPSPAYSYPLALFQGYGVELEYMIVDRDSLAVRPICDQLLHAISGNDDGEAHPDGEGGGATWSNELVLHVVEFKTAAPVATLSGLDDLFAAQARHANDILAQWNACLMPGAMHPWMNPETDMCLWPHDCNEIYEAFHRIFNCRGHGWANLQSVHINLPFANDEEFRRLHAAICTVLPLLPALAASSPVLDGKCNGILDNRVRVYGSNCARIPQITGRIVPEPAVCRAAYETAILAPIYGALKPLDPDGILQHEWANARGAIARFDRGTIEIRLLDIQECPKADLAIAELVCAVVKALTEEQFSTPEQQNALSTDTLHAVLMDAVRDGDAALLDYPPLARCLGVRETAPPMRDVWEYLAATCLPANAEAHDPLAVIFREGCLARRITTALAHETGCHLLPVYKELCRCLAENRLFTGEAIPLPGLTD